MQLYFLIFWIPAVASAVQLWLAWATGLLDRPVISAVWFFTALVFQVMGQLFSPGWAIGLALQAVLAITLAIRLRAQL